MADVLPTEEAKQAFAAQGVEAERSTREGLGAILRRDIETFRDVMTKAGFQPK
jgi:hypothetical protein